MKFWNCVIYWIKSEIARWLWLWLAYLTENCSVSKKLTRTHKVLHDSLENENQFATKCPSFSSQLTFLHFSICNIVCIHVWYKPFLFAVTTIAGAGAIVAACSFIRFFWWLPMTIKFIINNDTHTHINWIHQYSVGMFVMYSKWASWYCTCVCGRCVLFR